MNKGGLFTELYTKIQYMNIMGALDKAAICAFLDKTCESVCPILNSEWDSRLVQV